jgi:transposase
MTYTIDFRRKVLKVRQERSLTIEETSAHFEVGVATIVRWNKSIALRKHGFRRRKIDIEALRADVEEHPDGYQYERAMRFGVTQKAIWYSLKKIGVTYKKNFQASEGQQRSSTYFLPKDSSL